MRFVCRICPSKFGSNGSLTRHLRKKHSPQTSPVAQPPRTPPPEPRTPPQQPHFVCEMCGRQFRRRTTLSDHLRKKHGPGAPPYRQPAPADRFQCYQCHKQFHLKTSLTRHFRKKHFLQAFPVNKDYECEMCLKRFLLKASLSRHLKKKHHVWPSSGRRQRPQNDSPTAPKEKRFKCHVCERQFVHKGSLSTHLRKNHSLEVPPRTRTSLTPRTFHCNDCDAVYSSKRNLRHHLDKHVGNGSKVVNRFSCNLCSYSINTIDGLIQHYGDAHEVQIERDTLRFNDLDSFLQWKEHEEVRTYSKYVKHFGVKRSKNGCQRLVYLCHRQGSFKSKGNRRRHLKLQGSNKTVEVCPSRLIVLIEKTGAVSVDFIISHVGHDLDLGHLNLSLSERKILAARISMRVPFKDILDEVRNSTGPTLKRYNLITRKDLGNIERCFNLTGNRGESLESDAVSLDSRAFDSTQGLPYKPGGRIKEDFAYLVSETCRRTDTPSCDEADCVEEGNLDIDGNSTNGEVATYQEVTVEIATNEDDTFLQAKERFSTEILESIRRGIQTPEELSLAIQSFKAIMPTILVARESQVYAAASAGQPAIKKGVCQ